MGRRENEAFGMVASCPFTQHWKLVGAGDGVAGPRL